MAASHSKKWSQEVTKTSDALDLEEGVFSKDDPRSIARSLKHSADRSRRRKADPYRSAMSMLTFYIHRAGKTLSQKQRGRLEAANISNGKAKRRALSQAISRPRGQETTKHTKTTKKRRKRRRQSEWI